jgi:hypothetical protein
MSSIEKKDERDGKHKEDEAGTQEFGMLPHS